MYLFGAFLGMQLRCSTISKIYLLLLIWQQSQHLLLLIQQESQLLLIAWSNSLLLHCWRNLMLLHH
jgi:hypothetical protein